ncbi:MAG: cytochrome c oxidase assembly protein [Pirellulales bacterium]
MSPTFDAMLRSWPSAPWLAASLLASAVIYSIGWRRLHARDPDRWPVGRLAAFVGGLAAFYLALASLIEAFASLLLSVHMLQHLLLMMVAPPLVWLGWPLMPMLGGLPAPVRTYWVAPILRSQRVRRAFAALTHPLVAWPIFVAATWGWHLPAGYELGLSNDAWHVVQHLSFTAAALLFWFPVVRPFPSRPRWSKWLLMPYLLLADVQNTLLAAWLTFSSAALYPHYLQVPRIGGFSAMEDQRLAGVLMWVPGSVVFLVPLFWIAVSYFLRGDRAEYSTDIRSRRTAATTHRGAFDLLRVPILGDFLRWRYARTSVQLLFLLLAGLVVVDGLRGPQIAPMNLAGVLPWIHWRGLLILTLLSAGNFFCMACPLTLPRSLAGRFLTANLAWPKWLRNKWLAVVLVALFLWSYEAFALWDNPWVTAWIVVGYFVAAFAVDSLFSGGTFCKYVCPIGQFNFVQSLCSPLEVAVRRPSVCTGCTTHECVRGSATASGCQTQLFQPLKVGNLDCTFCLDCAHACPHQNVGVLARVPASTLWSDPLRSGIGRLSRRPDVAALVVLLAFGAFANAAGMIEPVVEWQDALRLALGDPPQLAVTTAFYFLMLVALPLVNVAAAAFVSARWSGCNESLSHNANRFAYALVPLGFGMWLAHYSFHFFTSWSMVVPVAKRFAAGLGWMQFGDPVWECACCQDVAGWIPHAELLMLDFGLLGSLYVAWRIAEWNAPAVRQSVKAFMPWAVLITLLFVAGVWIVFEPMEMRGTLPLATG